MPGTGRRRATAKNIVTNSGRSKTGVSLSFSGRYAWIRIASSGTAMETTMLNRCTSSSSREEATAPFIGAAFLPSAYQSTAWGQAWFGEQYALPAACCPGRECSPLRQPVSSALRSFFAAGTQAAFSGRWQPSLPGQNLAVQRLAEQDLPDRLLCPCPVVL